MGSSARREAVGCDERTWDGAVDGQTGDTDGHQQLIGHGVDDGADHRLEVVPPGDVTVDEVGDAGVREQGQGGPVVVVHEEVPYERSGDQPREGENVGDGVDVLVRRRTRDP